MPLEINLPDDDECLSLQEYIECLEEEKYVLSEQNDLIASATYLKKLGNNKDFLIDHVFADLKDCLQFQEKNVYAPEVLLLHATSNYFIRANIWKPITKIHKQVPGYRYDVCHDHNFDILTIGYLGPGYQSRAYTYDRGSCVGMLGETVNLIPEGTFTLTEGKVALYRAKQDVHIQMPPEKLSVSINLIPKGGVQHEMQFQFVESSGTIYRYLDFSGTEVAIRLAGLLGNCEHFEVLTQISQEHPSVKIRALSLVSQLLISNESDAEAIYAKMKATQPELVSHIVESELSHYHAYMSMFRKKLAE